MSKFASENVHAIMKWLHRTSLRTPAMLVAVGLGVGFLASPSARAVNNKMQLLSGGVVLGYGQGQTRFTGPGLSDVLSADFPTVGTGEKAVQTRMVGGGTPKSLWVRMRTQAAPSSGTFTFMVRVNDADTALTCQLVATGQCTAGAATVNLNNGDRMNIRVSNTFPDSGNVLFMYSMLLD